MQAPLWERIKIWFCDNFGHRAKGAKTWEFNNHRHTTCMRCRRTVSVPLEEE